MMGIDVGDVPPRERIQKAIEFHIPHEEWDKLLNVEKIEKETFDSVLAAFSGS